jgi:hypothetical protein
MSVLSKADLTAPKSDFRYTPCVDGSELARTFFTSQVGRCGRVFGL